MAAIDDLTAAVAANTTAVNAAVTALGNNDDAAIEAAVAQLTANNTALDNAVSPPAPADTSSEEAPAS